MQRKTCALATILTCLGLAGCVTNDVIVATAVDTVGVSVAGGTTEQGGNLVVGFKGAKAAVVPVQNQSGELLFLPDGAPDKQRGFSVLAVLGVDAAGGVGTCAGIHQVLAVGKPADMWALGKSARPSEARGC